MIISNKRSFLINQIHNVETMRRKTIKSSKSIQRGILFYLVLVDKCRKVSLFCPKALSTFWKKILLEIQQRFFHLNPLSWDSGVRQPKPLFVVIFLTGLCFPAWRSAAQEFVKPVPEKSRLQCNKGLRKRKWKQKSLKLWCPFLHISKMWHLKTDIFIVFI